MNAPVISTIVPIYNVEEYLSDAIDSIIAQDIGFLENVEIILVNDGSPDSSEAICKQYAKKYPNNIRYIKQENAGVSAARNNGLKHATGKFVHFFDSDDIISRNAYSRALKLLSSAEGIELVALRVEFFDGQLGEHPLNHKFTADRVVNVHQEPDATILHLSSCVIRREVIKHKFDTSIKISEDMKFLTELLKQNSSYGLIKSATYYYRKRSAGGSAIDGSLGNKDFYLVTPLAVYRYLFDLWRDEAGKVHPYVQNTVAYDLQWRMRQRSQEVLTKEEENQYKDVIRGLIYDIDDEILFNQKYLSIAQLLYMLKIKHGKLSDELYSKIKARADSTRLPVRIDLVEKEGSTIEIEGWIPGGSEFNSLEMKINDEVVPMEQVDNIHRYQVFLGDKLYNGGSFKTSISSTTLGIIEFYNQVGKRVGIVTKRQSRIPDKQYGYRVLDDKIIVNDNEALRVLKYSRWQRVLLEGQWLARILVTLKLRQSAKYLAMIARSTLKNKIPLRLLLLPFITPLKQGVKNIRCVGVRICYYATKPFINKPVWIISDRFVAAGDNGEAFFRYAVEHGNEDKMICFAIDKKAKDFHRLRQEFGRKIINSSGFKYRLLFLHSSKIISSHADDVVINPFGENVEHYYDLFNFDFIFLQHGVIRNDMSSWLHRYNKNIKLFVTSAEREYQSILDYSYYYPQKNILLSGLPRYDLLKNEPKGKLILAPTWRHSLASPPDPITGRRPYSDAFKNSQYFTFFNNLMNDKRIVMALEKAEMTGEFYIHPALEGQVRDFKQNATFTIKDFPYDYRTAFKEGSLLVTDYSSVLFDFAYLKKPVVYTQFDAEEFYSNQVIYTKGYMDDEKDGFGPVAYTYEETIKSIVAYIESGCVMEDLYKKRVEKFFRWHDRNNRKRVYEAIVGLK